MSNSPSFPSFSTLLGSLPEITGYKVGETDLGLRGEGSKLNTV